MATFFKPFEPTKYSKSYRYIGHRDLAQLCCSCGYPWGKHFGNNRCPNRDEVPKDMKPVKHIKPLITEVNNLNKFMMDL